MAITRLSDVAIGTVGKINIDGVPWNVRVLHKGKPSAMYDDSFDGGVWFMLDDLYGTLAGQGRVTIDGFFNAVEEDIRNAIVQVKVPYRSGGFNSPIVSSGANGLPVKVFLLSGYEVGFSTALNIAGLGFVVDGSKLDYFDAGGAPSAKRVGLYNGTAMYWETRSPLIRTLYPEDTPIIAKVKEDGSWTWAGSTYLRPAFVLPDTLWLDDSGFVVVNYPPVITLGGDADIGTVDAPTSVAYSVDNADEDEITVTEKLDGVVKRTYTATLGADTTVPWLADAAEFQRILNGAHTLSIVASDGQATTTQTVTFVKAVYSCSATYNAPMPMDTMPEAIRLMYSGTIPTSAVVSVLVCNNGFDDNPTWEDATSAVMAEQNYVFTNSEKTAEQWGVNFVATISRAEGGAGGHINLWYGGVK
jgi:hypothetical protein